MVCDGPDPPDIRPRELTPPPKHELALGALALADDSDDEQDNFGYEPLPQGPDAVHSDPDSEDESSGSQPPNSDVPSIEPMEAILTRDAWSTPRAEDPIQMDQERAQEVMSAMANFALPQASIPEWAQSITEEQWRQTLIDSIEKMRGNR